MVVGLVLLSCRCRRRRTCRSAPPAGRPPGKAPAPCAARRDARRRISRRYPIPSPGIWPSPASRRRACCRSGQRPPGRPSAYADRCLTTFFSSSSSIWSRMYGSRSLAEGASRGSRPSESATECPPRATRPPAPGASWETSPPGADRAGARCWRRSPGRADQRPALPGWPPRPSAPGRRWGSFLPPRPWPPSSRRWAAACRCCRTCGASLGCSSSMSVLA